jgi:DNA-binding transcriptional MocR family regulator
MYTIPCGQNPTGSVMPSERYDEIYAICQKHDVIIMEDDPYFGQSTGERPYCAGLIFTALQFAPYEPDLEVRERNLAEARAKMPPVPSSAAQDDALGVAKVFNEYAGVRSYLSRDVDGRVVRIDTFSKVFGPGMRMVSSRSNAAPREFIRQADRRRDGSLATRCLWSGSCGSEVGASLVCGAEGRNVHPGAE